MKTQYKLETFTSFGLEYFSNINLVMRQTRAELPDYVSFSEETLKRLVLNEDGVGNFIVDLTHKSFCQTPYCIDNSLGFGIIEAVKKRN
jgi:hypothetical protein